ncbi:MAG: hypothetical protein ABI889_13765 [Gemmatimonadota bacterium]
MLYSADGRLMKTALLWLVIIVSLALLTPWGVAHRQSFQPALALVAVVCGTLSGAASLVQAVMTALSREGGWRAAAMPLAFAAGCLLIAATFLVPLHNAPLQSYTLGGAAFFMIVGAVMQQRAREHADSR